MRVFLLVFFSVAFGATGATPESSSPFGLGIAFAQVDAGYLADVKDLRVTASYSAPENLTDVSWTTRCEGGRREHGWPLQPTSSFVN